MLVEDEPLGAGAEVVGPASCIAGALRPAEEAARDRGLGAAALDIDLGGETAKPVDDRPAALGVPFLFATGYGENCDTGGHADAPVLGKLKRFRRVATRYEKSARNHLAVAIIAGIVLWLR